MSRSISAPTLAALAAQMTRPGYLIEIGWSTPARLSSRGDLNWNSLVWVGVGAQVQGLAWDGSGEIRGTVSVANGGTQTVPGAFTYNALTYGVADVPIKVWIYDAAATATGDPVLVFDGVGDTAQVAPDRVVFSLVSKRAQVLFSPRQYITAEAGFRIIPPTGKLIYWGGQKYALNRQT
jgi:hypothetical protein